MYLLCQLNTLSNNIKLHCSLISNSESKSKATFHFQFPTLQQSQFLYTYQKYSIHINISKFISPGYFATLTSKTSIKMLIGICSVRYRWKNSVLQRFNGKRVPKIKLISAPRRNAWIFYFSAATWVKVKTSSNKVPEVVGMTLFKRRGSFDL